MIIIKVIFKHLSLKALKRFTEIWRRGRGYKNNYTETYTLRLYMNIHQYIETQSHLLHTLSLPLSLSPSLSLSPYHPNTHTHTCTHTHTHRFFEVGDRFLEQTCRCLLIKSMLRPFFLVMGVIWNRTSFLFAWGNMGYDGGQGLTKLKKNDEKVFSSQIQIFLIFFR